ncbi:MAG: universal stress protein [Nitrososphaeraceae archaeon]
MSASNSKFSKIMIAIDGSDHSFRAAEYALEVAKSFRSQLYAVTVTSVPEPYHLKQEDVLNKSREMADNMNDAKTWLENFKQDVKKDSIEFKAELISSHRPVDYVILEYAEENNVDLIVVGTRGRSGFKKLLLGSTASSVVSYAHCPVMVVK